MIVRTEEEEEALEIYNARASALEEESPGVRVIDQSTRLKKSEEEGGVSSQRMMHAVQQTPSNTFFSLSPASTRVQVQPVRLHKHEEVLRGQAHEVSQRGQAVPLSGIYIPSMDPN